MKPIFLTQGKVAFVDDVDYDRAASRTWCAEARRSDRWYAVTAWVNPTSRKKGILRLHKFILEIYTRFPEIDHIDGDGLNCTRSNLRACTRSQNSCNRPKQLNNSSGFKGVTWSPCGNKWKAQIKDRDKTIYLGQFVDAEEAAQAYDSAAKNLFGEFARLNFA